MPRLADYGLTIETTAKKRWLKRDGRQVAISYTQNDMLEWLDGAVTPSLEYCCDELWEQVDVEWVRGQWDKLATLMTPLGVAVMMDDSDMLFVAHVDADGCLVQPAVDEVYDPADWPPAEAPAQMEAGPSQIEIERDQALAQLDELRACNVKLAAEVSSALASLSEAEDKIKRLHQAQAQPSAEIVRLRDEPVRIAPRYLTVPVSEALYRWLESAGDRNRRSADDMARVLLVAFMRATGNREAA